MKKGLMMALVLVLMAVVSESLFGQRKSSGLKARNAKTHVVGSGSKSPSRVKSYKRTPFGAKKTSSLTLRKIPQHLAVISRRKAVILI